MEVLHRQNSKKGEFYIEVDGVKKAEMTYTWAGEDKIIIDHTEVDASLKGQKVGYQLVEEAVRFARKQEIKILPLCPFAKYAMDKKEAYNDVLF